MIRAYQDKIARDEREADRLMGSAEAARQVGHRRTADLHTESALNRRAAADRHRVILAGLLETGT